MDAHYFRVVFIAAAIGSMGASQRSANFIVSAPSPEMAAQISAAAEGYRRDLAIEWLGAAMPNWSAPCPIVAHVAPNLGAGGATSFLFEHGEVHGWQMTIQGSLERVLDSVLPHEVTHTIFATHFRRPLPRWADEGSCTTVEHSSERVKQQMSLVTFLRTNRGIPFSRMFVMKEYPHDVLPLYAQGYSLSRYLIAQGGRRKFLDFLADGMQDENWTRAVAKHYAFANLAVLQNTWLDWVRQGSPALQQPAGEALASAAPRGEAEAETASIYRGQNFALTPDPASNAAPAGVAALAPKSAALAPESATLAAETAPIRPLAKLVERDRSLVAGNDAGWHSPRREPTGEIAAGEIAAGEMAAGEMANARPVGDGAIASPSVVVAPRGGATGGMDQVSYQATRPQPAQRSRQIILEWVRPSGAPADPILSSDRSLADGTTLR